MTEQLVLGEGGLGVSGEVCAGFGEEGIADERLGEEGLCFPVVYLTCRVSQRRETCQGFALYHVAQGAFGWCHVNLLLGSV